MAIPNLLQRKQAILSGAEVLPKKIVIYGKPGSGKTRLAATVALSPHIKRVFWFDCDRSLETLMYLSETAMPNSALEKIVAFDMAGGEESLIAAETLINGFTTRQIQKLCYRHGKISCPKCKELNSYMNWSLHTLTNSDVVIIDPGSTAAERIYTTADELSPTVSHEQNIWGGFHKLMNPIQAHMLACTTNIIWVSHEMNLTRIKYVFQGKNRVPVEEIYSTIPMCGSRPYSEKFSKDYGYKIAAYVKGDKFKATVTPGEYGVAVVSARRPITLYDEQGQPSLVPMFDPTAMTVVEQAGPASAFKL